VNEFQFVTLIDRPASRPAGRFVSRFDADDHLLPTKE
jgi:hypothetical protein